MAREIFELKKVRNLWRTNFSGEVNQYNAPGYRRFTISLPEDVADYLKSKGANVRVRPPQNPEDETLYSLECFIGDKYPPKPIYRISKSGKETLTLNTIGELDDDKIDYMDLDISLSPWESNGRTGYKAYVNSIAVFVKENEFASRYDNIPDVNGGGQFVNPAEADDEEDQQIPF